MVVFVIVCDMFCDEPRAASADPSVVSAWARKGDRMRTLRLPVGALLVALMLGAVLAVRASATPVAKAVGRRCSVRAVPRLSQLTGRELRRNRKGARNEQAQARRTWWLVGGTIRGAALAGQHLAPLCVEHGAEGGRERRQPRQREHGLTGWVSDPDRRHIATATPSNDIQPNVRKNGREIVFA